MRKKINQRVYLDHAAATPLDSRVFKATQSFLKNNFGNPSALYKSGRIARDILKASRENVSKILHCKPEEIIFTSGGTESDALALLGVMRKSNGQHLITSKIEHPAVLNNAKKLEKEGVDVTYLNVSAEGFIDLKKLEKSIKPETTLVSIMYANNEIGSIQPIKEISKIIKKYRAKNNLKTPFLHTDACQAAGYLDINVQKLGIDLMTINSSKIYGPKGAGILYKKQGIDVEPLWEGGGHENRLRSGTENMAGIVGFAEALKIVEKNKLSESKRLIKLSDYFIKNLFEKVPNLIFNGPKINRLPNNINISIMDIEGESMLLYLDRYGIEVSTGSACDSQNLDPSHVILALGKPHEVAHSSIRFTLGRNTKKKDIDYVLKIIPKVAETLRKISPIYGKEKNK
ncbi:cysteine desulfurase family protein [Patescibacteria group bacterium]